MTVITSALAATSTGAESIVREFVRTCGFMHEVCGTRVRVGRGEGHNPGADDLQQLLEVGTLVTGLTPVAGTTISIVRRKEPQ